MIPWKSLPLTLLCCHTVQRSHRVIFWGILNNGIANDNEQMIFILLCRAPFIRITFHYSTSTRMHRQGSDAGKAFKSNLITLFYE